jgi:hypothetical protein
MFLYVAVLAVLYYVYTQREHLTDKQKQDDPIIEYVMIGIACIVGIIGLIALSFTVKDGFRTYDW